MDAIFYQQIINAIMLGSVYGLVAVGFTLLFGVLGVINLAHGETAMIGAFLALTGARLGLPLPVAVVVAGAGTAALAVVVERVCFRPFRKADILIPMLSTIGMSIFLQRMASVTWGADVVAYKVGMEVITYQLGVVQVSSVHFIIVALALVLMFALSYLIYKTKVGRGLRAVAENPDIARSIGINAGPIIILAFAVSGPIAGVAGILVGLNTVNVSPFMGVEMGLKALVAVVLGGMGNVYGAMAAGVIIGFAETFTTGYLSSSYRDWVVYGLLLLVLLLRPEGLLGRIESRRV